MFRILCLSLCFVTFCNSVCRKEPATGNCRAYIRSFYYDKRTGICDCFVYTGCKGNDNRFSSIQSCMKRCNVPKQRQIVTNKCLDIFKQAKSLDQLFNTGEKIETESRVKQQSSQQQIGSVPQPQQAQNYVSLQSQDTNSAQYSPFLKKTGHLISKILDISVETEHD